MRTIAIGSKIVGGDNPAYVIAEAGVNHNGDVHIAQKLIDAAKASGADAVKFQTFTVEEVVTEQASQAAYQRENTGVEESQASMLEKLALSYDDFKALEAHARQKGIDFLSTPFSIKDADFLHSLGIAAFKVSSGDLTNLPYLAHIAAFGKPILLSTGMATLAEIREAVAQLQKARAGDIILLQCTSEYPTPLAHANLRVMATLRKEFDLPVGFSDHTEGTVASCAAAALGACVIEKHFTLDRSLPGPDHRASLEPQELKALIAMVREIEQTLGSQEKKPSAEELATAKLVRKGIAARTAIRQGETLTSNNMCIVRPEGDMRPKEWEAALGKKAVHAIPAGTSLSWDMLE